MDSSIYKRKRVFSIGEKSSVLIKLSALLEDSGFSARWSNKNGKVNAVVQDFHGNHFDVVIFGKNIKPENKKLIIQRFRSQNEQLIFIDVLAPIPQLMMDQVKLAFLNEAGELPCILKTADSQQISIQILKDCLLYINSYELKWLSRIEEKILLNAVFQGGEFTLPVKGGAKKHYIVISVDSVVVYIREVI